MHLLNGVLVMNGLTSMKAPDLTSEPLLLINGAEASLSPGYRRKQPGFELFK